MKTILIGDDEYHVKEARTSEEKEKGLSGIDKLPEGLGMLFYFDKPLRVSFWMKDTHIGLDIIFINENEEIISVKEGIPEDRTPIIENNVKYVLEINAGSGISKEDEIDLNPDEDEGYSMKVLAPDGSPLYKLYGGERIVSRRETKILIGKAKKANRLKSDSAYKSLGKYIFKVLNGQDSRDPEYVELKD